MCVFACVLGLFKPLFDTHTPWCSEQGGVDGRQCRQLKASETRGKKRDATAAACPGLTLCWHRFRGAEFVLQGWFGFTGTQCNVWSRFGRRTLLRGLSACTECLVGCPDKDKMKDHQKATKRRHKHLDNVHCFADGLKPPLEACSGLPEQGMCHNGWTHGHRIANLFVFAPSGATIDCALSVPGSAHDSQVAHWGRCCHRLKDTHDETGGTCCVDSAFASANVPHLIRSSEDLSKAQTALERAALTEATSLGQAAEWGTRALQSAFPRLKDHIAFEKQGERAATLKLVPLLHNLRANRVGPNQIQNTHTTHLSKDANCPIKRKD